MFAGASGTHKYYSLQKCELFVTRLRLCGQKSAYEN